MPYPVFVKVFGGKDTARTARLHSVVVFNNTRFEIWLAPIPMGPLYISPSCICNEHVMLICVAPSGRLTPLLLTGSRHICCCSTSIQMLTFRTSCVKTTPSMGHLQVMACNLTPSHDRNILDVAIEDLKISQLKQAQKQVCKGQQFLWFHCDLEKNGSMIASPWPMAIRMLCSKRSMDKCLWE